MNERTRLYVAMALAALILFGWFPLVSQVERLTGWKLLPPPATQPATQPTTAPTAETGYASSTTAPATAPNAWAMNPMAPFKPVAAPTTQQADVLIGSAERKNKEYALQLRLSPHGGGVAGVTLNDFTERVGSEDPFDFEKPYGPESLALATKALTINGASVPMQNLPWQITQQSSNAAVATFDIADAAGNQLTLTKHYEVLRREDEGGQNGPRGYETKFTYTITNRSNQPMVVSSDLIGPTFPPSEQMRGGDRQVIAGFQGKNDVILKHDALEGFSGSSATRDYSVYDGQQLLWIGAGGNYFNGIVRPTNGNWIKTATASSINPDAEAHLRQVLIELKTGDITLAPGETKRMEARVFFGPRKREVLKNPYYSAAGVAYQHTLEITGSCALCTFQWLVDFLMLLLGVFQTILRDWGLAIIALVFVVRACLHPITKRAQINMAKMSKFQPEIERIKKKYENDKDGLNRAMMEFYKTQGATPILGCLPMFLQMPIWIALYSGLGSTFELRQAPFLYGLTWIKDLSQPDHLIKFDQTINFFFLHIDGINVIPFLLAIAFFLQHKLTPKPPASTPEQEQQQKMMQWMTLLFPVFLYSSPSGLNLYILTSTIFGVIESRIIRKHIKEREALQAANGPTIVDGEIIDTLKNKPAEPKKKTSGIWAKFQELQERAEQLRNDAEKKARDRKK
ncbi:MAG: YidC/Oxa1 family insertase periplasmic-domain containing protein [Tepidisphaeraceae bacterium]